VTRRTGAVVLAVVFLVVSQAAGVGVAAAPGAVGPDVTAAVDEENSAASDAAAEESEHPAGPTDSHGRATAAADGGESAPDAGEDGTAPDAGGDVRFVDPDERTTTEVTVRPDYAVEFWTGTVTPTPGLDPSVTDTERARTWALVQFYGSPTAATLDELAGAGYQDVGRLSRTTRYASVPTAEAQAVADHEAVRAVTRVRPAWKWRPAFRERIDGLAAGETLAVAVQTFTPLPDAEADRTDLVAVDSTEGGTTTYYGELSPAAVRSLRADRRVMWLAERPRPTADVSEGRRLVGAHLAERPGPGGRSGYTGRGVRVGILDSGIAHGHPHFDSTRIVDSKDWYDGDGNPEAHGSCSHGTHVAGTIAGEGYDPSRDVTIRGVAPNATLVPSNVFKPDANGDGSCDWVKKPVGLKKMFNKIDTENVDVISNSWGDDTDGNYDIRASWVDTWAVNNPDVLLVTSNGNAGETSHVGTPAVAKNVLAVGAVGDGSKKRGGNVTDGSIGLTNRDSYLNDLKPTTDAAEGSGRKKPELYAPGESITGPVVGGTYADWNGTSMAAPHVSGVAALVKEKYPNMGANQLRAELIGTAVAPRYDGYGVVNANDALFENAYEGRHAHVSGSLHKVRAPALTKAAKKRQKAVETHEKSVTITEDAERLVVTLSWLDPGNLVASKSDRLANDLDLVVNGPGVSRTVTTDSNVKQVVIDDPRKGTWTLKVRARHVTALTSQEYDLVYRTITAEPTLDVTDSRTVEVEPYEPREQRFTFDVTGTGAPVSGVAVDAETSGMIRPCDGWRENRIAGILSEGHTDSQEVCVEATGVPTSRRNGSVEFTVTTSNAASIDGAATRTVNRTVSFEFLPRPSEDAYDRGGSVRYDDRTDPVQLDPSRGFHTWDHSHFRCVGGGRFSDGKSAGDDCSAILTGGDEAAATEYWQMNLTDLSLHNDSDVDAFNVHLPSTHVGSALSYPANECGRDTVSAGGSTYEVRTEGRLIVRIDAVPNDLGNATARVNASTDPLQFYYGDEADSDRVTVGRTDSAADYRIERVVPCPVTGRNKSRTYTFTFGNGTSRNVGTYEVEIDYVIDVTRPKKIEEIQREMAVEHEAGARATRAIGVYSDLELGPDYAGRLGEEFRCPGTYNCGGRSPPWMRLVNDERVLVHVRNARGDVAGRYLLVTENGQVTRARAVADPASVDHTVDVYTDVTTTQWVIQSTDKLQAVGAAYENGQLRIEGSGPVNAVKFGALKLGVDVYSVVTDVGRAVGGVLS
jgi:subtilisin family serine protease